MSYWIGLGKHYPNPMTAAHRRANNAGGKVQDDFLRNFLANEIPFGFLKLAQVSEAIPAAVFDMQGLLMEFGEGSIYYPFGTVGSSHIAYQYLSESLDPPISVLIRNATMVDLEAGDYVWVIDTNVFYQPNGPTLDGFSHDYIAVGFYDQMSGDAGGGGLETSVQIDTYTSDDTWTKPDGAVWVEVFAIGGGGSGASGRKGAASSNRGGGGGGNAGRFRHRGFRAADLTGTVAVTIGVGNTSPGASVSANTTNGNPGNAGTATTFGSYVSAPGGNGGVGGTDTAAGGTAANIQLSGETDGVAGFSTFAGVAGGVASGIYTGGAGGLGGSITSGNAQINGAVGGTGMGFSATGFAGGSGGGSGAGGGSGTAATAGTVQGGGGGGGGGPGTNTGSTAGGAGSAGALYGSGGGGGGAATNSIANSGAGGNGANGILQVVTHF